MKTSSYFFPHISMLKFKPLFFCFFSIFKKNFLYSYIKLVTFVAPPFLRDPRFDKTIQPLLHYLRIFQTSFSFSCQMVKLSIVTFFLGRYNYVTQRQKMRDLNWSNEQMLFKNESMSALRKHETLLNFI